MNTIFLSYIVAFLVATTAPEDPEHLPRWPLLTVTANVMAPPTWMRMILFRATVGLLTTPRGSGATSVMTTRPTMLARMPLVTTAATTSTSLMLLALLQTLRVHSAIQLMRVQLGIVLITDYKLDLWIIKNTGIFAIPLFLYCFQSVILYTEDISSTQINWSFTLGNLGEERK